MQVLTVRPSTETAYETVFMFSHQSWNASAPFFNVETVAGQRLRLTSGHYLWSLRNNSMASNVGRKIVAPLSAHLEAPEAESDLQVGPHIDMWQQGILRILRKLPTSTPKPSLTADQVPPLNIILKRDTSLLIIFTHELKELLDHCFSHLLQHGLGLEVLVFGRGRPLDP